MAEADLLKVLERRGEVGRGGLAGRAVLGRGPQAGDRGRGMAARFQREQPGQVDDRGDTVCLEVDPASVLAPQVAREAQRRPAAQGSRGQPAEELPAAGGPADHPPQPFLDVQVAVDLPEVEEDRRLEQRLLLRPLDPAGELLLPRPQRRPPGRVGGHDVAGTAGEATALQGDGQPLGQRREPVACPRREVVGEDQRVVLVGAERRLAAGAAAQDKQRIRARRWPEGRLAVTGGLDIEGILGGAQESGDLARRGTGLQKQAHQPSLRGARAGTARPLHEPQHPSDPSSRPGSNGLPEPGHLALGG